MFEQISSSSKRVRLVSTLGYGLTSLLIITVIVIQTAVGSRAHMFHVGPFQRDPDMWPFLSYPMYRGAYYPGDRIERYRLFGVKADSQLVAITPETLGTGFWIWARGLVNPLLRDEPGNIAELVQRYEDRNGHEIVGLRVETHPLILTADGVEEGDPELVRRIRLDGVTTGQ